MADVVSLDTRKEPVGLLNGEPDAAVIAFVERLLDNAKSGKLQWLAVAQLTTDGFMNQSWTERHGDSASSAGCIALLQHEFLAAWSRQSGS